MIEINGLSKEQVEMLDVMWSLETEEDYMNWYQCLDDYDQNMADILMRMIILAEVDNQFVVDDCKEANEVLKRFMK